MNNLPFLLWMQPFLIGPFLILDKLEATDFWKNNPHLLPTLPPEGYWKNNGNQGQPLCPPHGHPPPCTNAPPSAHYPVINFEEIKQALRRADNLALQRFRAAVLAVRTQENQPILLPFEYRELQPFFVNAGYAVHTLPKP